MDKYKTLEDKYKTEKDKYKTQKDKQKTQRGKEIPFYRIIYGLKKKIPDKRSLLVVVLTISFKL